MEERILKQLGMTSLTIENLEEGKTRLEELYAENDELEAEKSGYKAQKEELNRRLKTEKERLAPIKERYDAEMKDQEKENYNVIETIKIRIFRLKERHVELDPDDLSLQDKRKGLEEKIAQAEEELAAAQKTADEAIKEIRQKYKADFKEIERIKQEYSSLDRKEVKVDKRLHLLHHLYSELNYEVDRLSRNREYFEKKAKS
ncbi:MAG: hypothetical protein IIZ33_05410 [Erysipelotrichaceae bacterium]|nr:hypothetical protein [Erysipelotrichaceae bacterium]